MITATDKDTWDVAFPEASLDDIILWDSNKYSLSASDSDLEAQFFADIRSNKFIVTPFPPKGSLTDPETKAKLKEKYYADWEADWIAINRWDTMHEDLQFVEDILYSSNEFLPSSLVLTMTRGWSKDGIGHNYGMFAAYSTSDIVQLIREEFVPSEVEDGDEYAVLVPEGSTLVFEHLHGPFYLADGSPMVDDTGASVFEGGVVTEFYHVKKKWAKFFRDMKDYKATKAKDRMFALNEFCEDYIAKNGKEAFIETYLDKLSNPIEHAWLGSELNSYWDANTYRNK